MKVPLLTGTLLLPEFGQVTGYSWLNLYNRDYMNTWKLYCKGEALLTVFLHTWEYSGCYIRSTSAWSRKSQVFPRWAQEGAAVIPGVRARAGVGWALRTKETILKRDIDQKCEGVEHGQCLARVKKPLGDLGAPGGETAAPIPSQPEGLGMHWGQPAPGTRCSDTDAAAEFCALAFHWTHAVFIFT